jgi:hypothetical protein
MRWLRWTGGLVIVAAAFGLGWSLSHRGESQAKEEDHVGQGR